MDRHARGLLLWSRALTAGGLSFGLGVIGHVTADGLLPGPITLAVLAALSVVTAAAALARRASYLRLVGLVLTLQAITHVFLGITAGHRGDSMATAPASGMPAGMRLPSIDGRRVGSLLDAYAAQAGHQSVTPALPVGHLINDISANLPMVLAHLVASVLVGLWLGVGERALWALLVLLGHHLLPVIRLGLPPVHLRPATRRPAPERRVHPRRTSLILRPHPRRGPPLLG